MSNPILNADFYTVCSEFFASPKAKEKSVYNYTNRYSPTKNLGFVCKDDRQVFFGLSEYIRRYLTTPITINDILEAESFMKEANSLGGGLPFPKDLWLRVLREYDGFLPIKIEALPEGSCFFPNEPVVQVTSLDNGFGELAAHIEAGMVGVVSNATVMATLCRHWLERFREILGKESPMCQFMIHNFGMRASSCLEESEILGLAHLLVFYGTDNTNAAFLAKKLGAKHPTGTSILALAHRNVQGWGNDADCFNALYEAAKKSGSGMASFVLDCYNTEKALLIIEEMAKKDKEFTFVGRPDSGDYISNIKDVINKKLNNLRYLEGNGVNPQAVDRLINELGKESINHGIFGCGGFIRNACTRDAFSSAYKLSSIGKDNQSVMKLSEELGKMSVPGPNCIRRFSNKKQYENWPTVIMRRFNGVEYPNNAYKTYYDGGEIMDESFAIKQERCLADFDFFKNVSPDILSEEIISIQLEFRAKHREST